MQFNHLPVFNLKAVLNETGVKAELLRAWERRYRVPAPQRTSGGHRLYSDYDIALIKWLRARQSEGMSISSAVELWREFSESGRDPLLDSPSETSSTEVRPVETAGQIDLLRQNWLNACMAFDSLTAGTVMDLAFSIYPVETVCSDLLQGGLSEIGELWYQGKVTVQQEHFASNLAIRRIETLIAASPNPTRSQTILLACPAGEWHTFPALLLNLFLRRKGFDVVYLGANMPLENLEQTAAVVRPSAIILTAQRLATAASVKQAGLVFQKMKIPLAFGGRIFNLIPELQASIPGAFLGESLNDSIDRLEKVILHHEIAPIKSDDHLTTIVTHFQSKKLLIEARVIESTRQQGMNIEYINEVNDFFSSSLIASLMLGDLAYIESDLEWVKSLLEIRKMSGDLFSYLMNYAHAVDLEMGDTGRWISHWIHDYIKKAQGNKWL